jgi:hypothetical protein
MNKLRLTLVAAVALAAVALGVKSFSRPEPEPLRQEHVIAEAERDAFGLYKRALDAMIGKHRKHLMRIWPGESDSKLDRIIKLGYDQVSESEKFDTVPDGDGYKLAENFAAALADNDSDDVLGILITNYLHLQAAEETLSPLHDTVFAAENPLIFDYGAYSNPAHFAQFYKQAPGDGGQGGRTPVIVFGDVYTKPHMQMIHLDTNPSDVVDPSDVDVTTHDLLPSAAMLRRAGINKVVVGMHWAVIGTNTSTLPDYYDSHNGLREYFADLEVNGLAVSFVGIAER